MRITNKIMQNNSLYNINNNKVTENDVTTSIMTGKKINRPSEDPVIAIRALRLRANVTELSQYYEKNAKDAAAWLQVTEGALTSISGESSILVDLKKLINAGPDKYKTLSDWQSIVTQIEQLSDEYYNVGNVDYAGRYAFTGYRTDTSLSFMEDTSKKYEDIQDEFNANSLDTSDRVTKTGEFASGDELSTPMSQSDVTLYTVGRLRLSYDNLDAEKMDAAGLTAAQTDLADAEAERDSKKAALDAAKAELAAAKEDLYNAQKPLYDAQKKLEKAEDDLKIAEAALKNAEENLVKSEEMRDEAVVTANEALADYNTRKTDFETKYNPDYQTKLDAVNAAQAEVDAVNAQIEALDTTDPDYADKKAALEQELANKKDALTIAEKDFTNWTKADPVRFREYSELVKAEKWKDSAAASRDSLQAVYDANVTNRAAMAQAKTDAETARDTALSNRNALLPPVNDAKAEVATKQSAMDDALDELAKAQEKVDELNGKLEAVVLRYRESMAVSASSTVMPASYNADMVNLSFTTSDGASHTVHLPVKNGTMQTDAKITIENPDGTKETYTAYYQEKVTAGNGDVITPEGYRIEYTVDRAGAPESGTYSGNIYLNSRGVICDGHDPDAPVSFPADDDAIHGGSTPANYGDILAATSTVTQAKLSEVKMTVETGTGDQETIYVPLSDETKQPYEMTVKSKDGKDYIVTVNTDGTFTLTGDCKNMEGKAAKSVVQLNSGGAVHSSYVETELKPSLVLDATSSAKEIDDAYALLQDSYDNPDAQTWNGATGTDSGTYILNAATGEILLSKGLNDKLTSLKDLINAKTLDAVYDKTNYKKGDTRPENLFACTHDGVKYNIGTAGHTMEYDVGFNQKIEVNTTANEVFTNEVKRDAQDLRRILDQMTDVNNKLNILKQEYDNEKSEANKLELQKEIDAAQKAYDYLTDIMKDEFGAKITGVTKAIDMANNAVTINGTRSKRLDLIESRLMDQTATFKELQSENEDVDLAEAGTMLAMARLTYEASLQATGKIMTTSLMDYI
ncbi:MAG: hypothetical protein IK016_02120 [Lachnospiraceae bacterium]|nr:hypothetical protein [Lachnospiraceae bacterium]